MIRAAHSRAYFVSRRGQTTPQMFCQFSDISHYFALLKKYWLFLHQTWQMSWRPIANYIYEKNVSKCQSCDVIVMTSCFLPLLKCLICIFFYNVFERAHQGELKPERILSISQKLNEIWHFQIWKITMQNTGSPPWEKSPNWSRNFVPANAAMLHMWCARWLKQK